MVALVAEIKKGGTFDQRRGPRKGDLLEDDFLEGSGNARKSPCIVF